MNNKFLKLYLLIFYFSYCFGSNNKIEKIFTQIYQSNYWGDAESVSGQGSSLFQTKIIRQEIPKLLKQLNIQSLLDSPCGDFNWMKEIILNSSLKQYIGVDIVADLVKRNNQKFSKENIKFLHLNIINDALPKVDLIICRDCLLHFSHKDLILALKNFKKSGSRYLLTTHFTGKKDREYSDIETGSWRPINYNSAPFNFPKPLMIIVEQCPQIGFPDKSLALWELKDLNV